MTPDDVSKVEKALFLLVKSALNKNTKANFTNDIEVPIAPAFGPDVLKFDHMEWGKLITLAKKQGVQAISLDGFPHEYLHMIPKDIKIRWDRAVEQVEERHQKQIKVLKELTAIFKKNSVSTVIINNMCISKAYPIAKHRECADLNIAQPGSWEKGNKVIDNLGINVHKINKQHSIFNFRGITVHNHNIDLGKTEKVTLDNIEITIPERDFAAIFLTRQTADNFLSSSIVMRHLADLSLFFEEHSQEINFEQLTRELNRERILKIILHLLILSQKLLGFEKGLKLIFEQAKESRYISKKSVYSDFSLTPMADKIRKDLTSNEFIKSNINDLITMSKKERKTLELKNLLSNKWKYTLFKRRMFYKTLLKILVK
jgi:hypothetical protein